MTDVRAALAAGAAFVMLGAAGAASASFPGGNGKLAYFWGNEVFALQSDGSGARSLGRGLSPAWSPSGRALAFDVLASGNYDVWVMRADGSGRRRVTRNAAPDYFASWSPDARWLVFTSDRDGEDLYVVRADGRGERRLTTHPAPEWGAAWSPGGARIAFAGNARGNLEVEIVNADGSGRFALTDHAARDYDPAWSPDGTRIAFTSERDGNADVYVMNADGSGVEALTDDASNDWRPAWSPDGTKIVFESDRDPAAFDRDLYVMNADGSDERRLRSGNVNARDADWQPVLDVGVTLRVVRGRFFATVLNTGPITARGVVLTVAAGGRRRLLRLGSVAAASARGRYVVAPRTVRRMSVSVASWHADPNPRNDRAGARR